MRRYPRIDPFPAAPGTHLRTYRMKASRRILFIKNGADAAFARSWVVDELGMHSRIISDAALLGRVLTGETFDVVLLDQRGSNEELIPSIEGMRRYQPTAKLVIVSDSVALADVQQAMRFNVHDIFLPPFELVPIIERVESVVARLNGATPTPAGKVLARWSELSETLQGKLDVIFIQNDKSVGAATVDTPAPAGETPEEMKKLLDDRAAEIETLRSQLAEAVEARARLNDQIAQLSAGASALGRAEARARSLEAEVIELRKGALVEGSGSAEIVRLQDELERARERINELERLNSGLLAGNGGSGGSESDERVRELEAELASLNEKFEAAGQAFATEMEQVMAREAEAMAALAAAEDRERKAQAVMTSAGEAFGRADETIEKERGELQKQRETLKQVRASLEEERAELVGREERLESRTKRLDALSQEFAEDVERTIASLGALTEHASGLLQRREAIRKLADH